MTCELVYIPLCCSFIRSIFQYSTFDNIPQKIIRKFPKVHRRMIKSLILFLNFLKRLFNFNDLTAATSAAVDFKC